MRKVGRKLKEFESLKAINDACAEYTIAELRYTDLLAQLKQEIQKETYKEIASKYLLIPPTNFALLTQSEIKRVQAEERARIINLKEN